MDLLLIPLCEYMAIFPPSSDPQKFVTALNVPALASVIKKGIHVSRSLSTPIILFPWVMLTFTRSLFIRLSKLLFEGREKIN